MIKNLKKQKKIYFKKKEKVPMNIEDLIKELTELEESRKRQVKKGISSGTTPLIIHINKRKTNFKNSNRRCYKYS